jgi:hypothetical protein
MSKNRQVFFLAERVPINITVTSIVANTAMTDELFQMSYWDIRFSNLCNLVVVVVVIYSVTVGIKIKLLAGAPGRQKNQALNYAGRTATDMWEQLIPHLDYVEKIYFAGGEPLMMEEHYNILMSWNVAAALMYRLIYNTNFTHVKLKDRYVFDYWRSLKVCVGASLDAMGPRAEYIRKGTVTGIK